jgi:hypothetical protein
MNRMRTWIATLLAILFCTAPLYAQGTESEAYRSKKVILPFMSHTPETCLMGGGLMMVQIKPEGAGTETRASQLILSGIYSLNRQLMIELTPNVILDGNEWLFEGRYEYSFFPDNYWGVGPFTGKYDEMNVEFRSIQFQQTVLKNIGNHLYAGVNVRWGRLSGVQFSSKDGEPVPDEIISGRNGSRLTGAGLRFNLNPNDTSNLRIDYGIGKHGSGMYITIGEAF